MVKGSCTVEFRVSLEEKKTDGKVFIVHKKYSRNIHKDLFPIHPESCNDRARPRLSGRSLVSPRLLKDVLLGLLASSVLL